MYRDRLTWRDTLRCKPLKVEGGSGSLGLPADGEKKRPFFPPNLTALFARYCSQKPSIKKPHMYKAGNRDMASGCVPTHKRRDRYHRHAWIGQDDAHEHVGQKREPPFFLRFWSILRQNGKSKCSKGGKRRFSLIWGGGPLPLTGVATE